MNTYINPEPTSLRLYLNGYLQGIFPRNEQGLYQARNACYTIISAVLYGQFCKDETDIQKYQFFILQQANIAFQLNFNINVDIECVGAFNLI